MADVHLAFLRDIAVFGGLPDAVLTQITEMADQRSYAPGDFLVYEGEPGQEMFVLLAGRAEVRKDGQHLRDIRGGDCIGEMSLIDIQPRSASVVAVEQTLAMVLCFKHVGALQATDLESYTLLMMNFAREISRRLRHANEMVMGLGRTPWSVD